MASVLLVSYAGYPVMMSSFFPDNGLASLAGSLKAAGHQVLVLDLNTVSTMARLVPSQRTEQLSELLPALSSGPDAEALERLVSINSACEQDLEDLVPWLVYTIESVIREREIDLLGFKLWSGDGFLGSVKTAHELRKMFPLLKIVGGGPAVLTAGDAIFDITDVFDVLVAGEGEEAVVCLADWMDGKERLEDVPNLILPGGEKTKRRFMRDLEKLPQPIYSEDVYPSLSGDDHIKLFVLDESRGCPNRCAFCVHRQASGGRWRVKSAARVVDEIAEIQRLHGSSAYRLGGSYTPPGFYKEFGELLLKKGSKIRFSGFGHPSGMHTQDLSMLKKAGCRSIFFGVESFHESDSKMLGKKLDPAQSMKVVRSCIDSGIVPVVSIIYPIPGQSQESKDVNVKICKEFFGGTKSSLITQFPGLFPETKWFKERNKFGFRLLCGESEFVRLSATYRIRHIIPPTMWEELPYKVDGSGFFEFAKENAAFQRELSAEDVVLNISDDMALLADVLELEIKKYHSIMQSNLFSLNSTCISDLVQDLNKEICL